MKTMLERRRRFSLSFLLAVAALILAACASQDPQIVVEPAVQDLGERPQERIELTYTVRNAGEALLVIEKVSTSCDCTQAELDQTEIPPGGSTRLRVSLDPVEDDLYGEIKRVIYLRSNDPENPEVSVEFNVRIQKP